MTDNTNITDETEVSKHLENFDQEDDFANSTIVEKTPSDLSQTIERSFLGGIIANSIAAYRIFEVDATDFQSNHLAEVYQALTIIINKEENLSLNTLARTLESEGLLPLTVAEPLLKELEVNALAEVFSDVAVDSLITSIKELSFKRASIQQMHQALNKARSTKSDSIFKISDQLVDGLRKLREKTEESQGPFAISKYQSELEDTLKKPYQAGIPSGFQYLDNMTGGWLEQNYIVLGARTSIGKTSLALSFALKAAEYYLQHPNKPIIFFSLEMGAMTLIIRLLSLITSIPYKTILDSNNLTDQQQSSIANGYKKLMNYHIYIDDTSALTPQMMHSKTKRVAETCGGVGMVLIDYIGIMKVPEIKNNKVMEVSEISASIKKLAKDHKCPVIALSQLKRESEKEKTKPNDEHRPPPRYPILTDLKESGSLEQDADQVILIHRERDEKDVLPAVLLLRKNRNGMTGVVHANFQSYCMRFLEVDNRHSVDNV